MLRLNVLLQNLFSGQIKNLYVKVLKLYKLIFPILLIRKKLRQLKIYILEKRGLTEHM